MLKGLVLCGGKGTRLRPLTHTAAKQLVLVANRPFSFTYSITSARLVFKILESFLGPIAFVMYLGANLIGGGIREFCEDFERNNPAALILLKQVSHLYKRLAG